MKKKYLLVAMMVVLFLVGFASINYLPLEDIEEDNLLDSIPTRSELRRNFFEKREVLVVYAAKDSAYLKQYRQLLHAIALQEPARSWRSATIKYRNAASVTEEELSQNVVFLVGKFQDHPVLKRFIASTPFKINTSSINIGSRTFSSTSAIIAVSFYPNPLNTDLPFSFITGVNEQQVFNFFTNRIERSGQSFYRQNLDYELYQKDKRLVMGDFNPFWKTEGATFFDFSNGTDVFLETEDFRFISHQKKLERYEITATYNRVATALKEISAFVGPKGNVPKISYHIYNNMEEKGLMTGNTDQAHIDTLEGAVHVIDNTIYKGNHIGKENALLLHYLLGASNKTVLSNGFPVYFTNSWQVKGYRYWGARLFESGNALSLVQLLNNDQLVHESSLIRDCMGGLLVDFLIETWGKESFLARYNKFELDSTELQTLETQWQNYLETLPVTNPKQQKNVERLPYVKGFNFAHEGYSIYNGYGSSKATQSLKKQRDMGSNAMAIVPYSGIPDINSPAPFRFSNSAGNENDESVVHATAMAKELGMFTLLKPQIFVGGSWPGGIEMLSQQDWDLFFDHYYRWIRHYAFLAEIHGMDALSIGVEFTKATLGHPEAWRTMIKKTRGLFTGQLTYSANWGTEFEDIEFWDELDFIGLNCYYPLSKDDNPTDEELAEKFETVKTKIIKVHERFNKPIVFTEIGFRSINAPWKNPHAEADESINEEMQQRCYKIIFEGIEGEPWCQGILWWKFPSYLEYRGEENNAFTPNNKLAEETVREWFSK